MGYAQRGKLRANLMPPKSVPEKSANWGFATRAIHSGQEPDPATGAVIPPIYQTSTYAQEQAGVHQGFDYSRTANPSRQRLEQALADLEGGRFCLTYSTGMAALSALLSHFKSGDHIIVSEQVYGGTFRVLTQIFSRSGLQASWVDTRSIDHIAAAVGAQTRAILIETPSNPMMHLTDIEAVAQLARKHGLLCIVDNTFMTPYGQRPLELGAHVVHHSVTKYLGGHSDLLLGALITDDEELAADLRLIQGSVGAVPSPFECWLASRSLKTLAARMELHHSNAGQLAEVLQTHLQEGRVYYSGLTSHPQHGLAGRQQRTPDGRPAFGGMISFEVGSLENCRAFIDRLEIFTLAESLGGVESLVCIPAVMTHASIPREKRAALGITDSLVRLSVGIEDLSDLRADLERGLAGLNGLGLGP